MFGNNRDYSGFGNGRGYDNEAENRKVQERVFELANGMVEAYQSSSSAEEVAQTYESLIREAGFQVLGRGQNRIAFRVEGSAWVYKVPFREVGFRDNAIERYSSSVVSSDATAFKALGAHMPMVSNFSLGNGYQNFMICAEYIKNLESKSGEFLNDTRDAAIYAAVEHYKEVSAFLGAAQTQAAMEMYRKPLKAKFRAPNMIEFDVRGASPYVDTYELRIKVGHPKSLYSIDEPHYIMMHKLGIYDVQELLWNSELKGLDGLSNGYDNIALRIDDWQNASQNRAEYIKELESDIVLMEGISSY